VNVRAFPNDRVTHSIGKCMLDVGNSSRRVNCRVRGIELVESPHSLCIEDLDNAALAEMCQFLGDTISRLQDCNAQLRAANSELKRKSATAAVYRPTQLACDILLRYCSLDTTELSETRVLAMCAEDDCAVRSALIELCEHGLLVMAATVPHADKLYAVTTAAQTRCFAFQR
jgi:hypothetical protein